jgi:alginate O-acetyltransferase complex protein AlgI
MSFTSLPFAVLLLVVLLVRVVLFPRGGSAYLGILLLASLLFYGWHTPWYLALILGSAAIDYLAGARLAASPEGSPGRENWLQLSLVANLGLLAFFKYGDFGLGSLRYAIGWLGLPNEHIPRLDLVLPVGISFFTFQSMSYTIDVYRGVLRPVQSFRDFLLFVAFFPQLVAGPIVRARDFLPQLGRPRRPHPRAWRAGLALLVQGMFLKTVLADNLGVFVDQEWAWASAKETCSLRSLVAVVAFSAQIFADFAGYSRIARGVAYLLGYRLPENFDAPYLATSLRGFWRHWHITLSTWLRDYLYFSLGGSREGTARTYRNLMLTMVLGGIWHGAAWTFVAWGVLHGLGLCLERVAFGPGRPAGPGRLGRWAVTQAWVLLTWVFFRATSLGQASALCENILAGSWTTPLGELLWRPELLPVAGVAAVHLLAALGWRRRLGRHAGLAEAAGVGAMLYAILALGGGRTAFLYFQF